MRKNLDVTKLYGVHILPVPFEVPLHIYSFSSKGDLMRTNSNTDNRIVKNFLQSHFIEIHALMLSAWEP